MQQRAHAPVMLVEAIEALAIRQDGIYVDATFGRGGHSREIVAQLGHAGKLYVIDRDPCAIEEAQRLAQQDARVVVVKSCFSELRQRLLPLLNDRNVDGVLFDLGVSSPQLDAPERGFSFMQDGPLDMRMDPERGVSAAQWLARAEEEDIARVIWEYGEERFSRKIARAIVTKRAIEPIETTQALSRLIAGVVRSGRQHKHPATRSFQALRIQVNDELNELQQGLIQAMSLLKVGARLVVISFHSLEDRMVKRFMREQARDMLFNPKLPFDSDFVPKLRILRKQKPSENETNCNPRARSAVMRIAEKLE